MLLFQFACQEDPATPGTSTNCTLTVDEETLVEALEAEFAQAFTGATLSVVDPQLSPLINYLGEAQLVGLGEGTHGTAEFFRLKDKLFRSLVEDKGFKGIVFEIPWGNALLVNEFVLNGIGTADEVVDQTYYWTYNTQEVRNLVQWMYEYNQGRPLDQKIYFVGCDPQGGDFSVELAWVRNYLDQVQLGDTETIMANYNSLPTGDLSRYGGAVPATHEINIEGTQNVLNYFTEQASAMVAASSELDYQIALMAVHLIQQREYIYRIRDFGVARDSLMAVYAEWWQNILAPDAKLAVWAHNFHVMDGSDLGQEWMGNFLRQRYGDQYLNLAFSFGRGTFNAFEAGSNGEFVNPVRRQLLSSPPCNSVNQLLSAVEGDQHYLILEQLDGEAQTYFGTEQRFLQFGAGFNADYTSNYTRPYRLSRLFDVIVHFDDTEASVLR